MSFLNTNIYEAVLDRIDSYVWILDQDGEIVHVNEPALSLVEQDLGDVLGILFSESPWIPQGHASRAQVQTALERAFTESEEVSFEIRILGTHPNDLQLVRVLAKPIGDGEVVEICVINASDVDDDDHTARLRDLGKQIVAVSRREKIERYLLEYAIGRSPLGIAIVDAHGRFVFMNEEAEAALGGRMDPNAAVMDWPVRHCSEDGSEMAKQEVPVIRALHGEVVEDETYLLKTIATGESSRVSATIQPFWDANLGAVVGAVMYIKTLGGPQNG